MLQPKQFYRNLDLSLGEIQGRRIDSDGLSRLVEVIVDRFGGTLHIANGRLYRETPAGFVLDHDVNSIDPSVRGLVIPADYPSIDCILQHGVFLFDGSINGQSEDLECRLGGLESAGLLADNDTRHILAFGLRPGWQRDDLDFALNTIRNAINHRTMVQALETDLEQAAEIQRSLLPATPPSFPGFRIAARSIAATKVGGDFYDFLELSPETLGVAVGDASGHGLGAALVARDVVTGLRMGAERDHRINVVIERLNRVIARSSLSTRFASLFYGELEQNGSLFYINAGHPPAWILGDQGLRRLEIGGTVIGPLVDATFKRGFAHIDRGDTFIVVTDGILERENWRGELFGEQRVEAVLGEHHGAPPELILDRLFAAAARHGDGRHWKDDTTAVVITRDATAAGDGPKR